MNREIRLTDTLRQIYAETTCPVARRLAGAALGYDGPCKHRRWTLDKDDGRWICADCSRIMPSPGRPGGA